MGGAALAADEGCLALDAASLGPRSWLHVLDARWHRDWLLRRRVLDPCVQLNPFYVLPQSRRPHAATRLESSTRRAQHVCLMRLLLRRRHIDR